MVVSPPSPRRPPALFGPAQMTMGFVLVLSISAVVYSHYSQVRDRNVMRAGVERDKERLRLIRQQQREEAHQKQKQGRS